MKISKTSNKSKNIGLINGKQKKTQLSKGNDAEK
jgi:hypothetical protein